MPIRFLRPGITTSERWNTVTFAEQSLYIRLLTLVDDFGRCDGRASVLWGQCWPVWNEHNPKSAITLDQTEEMLNGLAGSQLISQYTVDGKKVIQITQWKERVRSGVKEKWPPNPDDLLQVAASCHNLQASSPSPSPSPCTPVLAANGSPLKRKFTDLWCKEFLNFFGDKYAFQGAKDGQAADRLLKLEIPPERLVFMAMAAWKKPDLFNCKQAITIAGFASRFNQIRAELKPRRIRGNL